MPNNTFLRILHVASSMEVTSFWKTKVFVQVKILEVFTHDDKSNFNFKSNDDKNKFNSDFYSIKMLRKYYFLIQFSPFQSNFLLNRSIRFWFSILHDL